ncbi:MAG: glycerol kinase GlpK [Clostridia bacterium]|nr:glycerol kinase GlpK [Clostridia bacterium]
MKQYIVALDQGTTSSRCIIFDRDLNIVAVSQKELQIFYPRPGWVEQRPLDIWVTQYGVLTEALLTAGLHPSELAAIGITNQRETTVVWDKESGEPICNAIVWQCRRTADRCKELDERETAYIRAHTGLVVDPYFSATKLEWILQNVEGAREKAEAGKLLFGTVDTYLIWKLTGGKVHATDYTNASRTMLYDIHRKCWDEHLLELFGIPASMLPAVRPSLGDFGMADVMGEEVPICGVAGDQQSALFGQCGFEPGTLKSTYGTGCFALMNMGNEIPDASQSGLLVTLGASPDGAPCYCLEGSVFMGGAVVQWLRDELKMINDSADSSYFASKVEDSGGVILVPAFTGLGAPYWDAEARGSVFGMTRGTNRNHLIRACLDSIAYQTADVLKAMEASLGKPITCLKVDGGATANPILMQFQADLLQTEVCRPMISETTALGAAFLAGLACGFWQSTEELTQKTPIANRWQPALSAAEADSLMARWHTAVAAARMFK